MFVIILFTGCTKEYRESDIDKYIRENLHLSNYKISSNYKYANNGDALSDKIWTVINRDNNVEFHIYDDFSEGMEGFTENFLKDDYEESLFLDYYKKIIICTSGLFNV